MDSIHDIITNGASAYVVRTGTKPSNVYLGCHELKSPLMWAQENDYIADHEHCSIEGDNRPEVGGLQVYVVNAPSHLGFS